MGIFAFTNARPQLLIIRIKKTRTKEAELGKKKAGDRMKRG
jgi:hypothetical protein